MRNKMEEELISRVSAHSEDTSTQQKARSLEKQFILAVLTRNQHALSLCLEQGVNPNLCFPNSKTTAMHCFAERGDVTFAIRLSMASNIFIDMQDEESFTPLHLASIFGKMKMVILLVRCGADINLPTRIGRTPLMLASRSRHTDVVKLLLNKGALVNVTDYFGCTALSISANQVNTSLVRLLMKHGADPMLHVPGQLPILFDLILKSWHYPSLDMIKLILEAGGDDCPDTDDPQSGKNCLHYVALTGNLALADLLLRYCRDVTKMDITGKTPLDVAVLTGDRDMIGLLGSVYVPGRDHSRFFKGISPL